MADMIPIQAPVFDPNIQVLISNPLHTPASFPLIKSIYNLKLTSG